MDKLNSELNFLKWQLLARLPKGSIYTRIKESLLHSDLESDDPYYYIYWLDIKRSLLRKYVLGTFKTVNADYTSFIDWLRQYKKGNFYSIVVNGITINIPCPFLEDYKCFKAEFLDIIMPSITGENEDIPYLEGPYEYHRVSLTKGDVVLDLGANYGLFSSLASAKGCSVFAFEPTTQVVNRYLKRLAMIDENIKVIEKAVSNFNGSSYFKLNEAPSCNCLVQDAASSNVTTVKTTTVDSFVLDQKLNRVDFIKADIEGAERLMLEGARRTLRLFSPKLAICCYHSLDDLRVLTKLIKEANSNYEIEVRYKKIYAYNPQKEN